IGHGARLSRAEARPESRRPLVGLPLATGTPGRYLLGNPRIAVGICEGAERSIAGALGVGAWLPCLDRKRRAVPDVTDADAAADEFVMRRLDIGDGQAGLG